MTLSGNRSWPNDFLGWGQAWAGTTSTAMATMKLIIGAGKGGKMAVFRGDGKGGLRLGKPRHGRRRRRRI